MGVIPVFHYLSVFFFGGGEQKREEKKLFSFFLSSFPWLFSLSFPLSKTFFFLHTCFVKKRRGREEWSEGGKGSRRRKERQRFPSP